MLQILVIDDERAICRLVDEILSHEGYQVKSANGVASGIAAALEQGPDLVLCDVMLGDGSGFDVLEALQQHPRLQGVPFVFMSGQAVDPRDVRKGMVSGADDYLLKPFRIYELLETVQARIARARRLASHSVRALPDCYAGTYESLQQLLAGLGDEPYCLMAVGLHRFERFLRLFGWQEADLLVQSLVERLLGQLNGQSPEAYLSHEPHKFYLLWRGQTPTDQSDRLAHRVLQCLSQPQPCQDHLLHLAAQAGILQGPASQATTRADLALTRAEQQGAGSVASFSAEMEHELMIDLHWEQELYQAFAEERFEIFYQPQVALCEGLPLFGVEALLRLNHPRLGLVPPTRFIPVAESCGLMDKLGAWVLERSCEQICRWSSSEGVELKIAVNVSQSQFQRQDFAATVAAVLSRTGIDPAALELEITESMMMLDPQATLVQLEALKALGLSLAMDDFGTGYSSLATLSRLPFDLLKIDRAFVSGLGSGPGAQAIPRAITEMGHSLGMRVLAEGIETAEHLQQLQSFGCDLGQGYLIARPMPAAAMPAFWRQQAASA